MGLINKALLFRQGLLGTVSFFVYSDYMTRSYSKRFNMSKKTFEKEKPRWLKQGFVDFGCFRSGLYPQKLLTAAR